MPTSPFSDRAVAALKYNGQRVDYWDSTFPKGFGSFGLRVGARSKVWRFAYYPPATRAKLVHEIGHYPRMSLAKARTAALVAVGQLAQGVDPFAVADEQETRPGPTLRDLVDRYIERYAKK